MKLYFLMTERKTEEVLAQAREADLDFALEGDCLVITYDPSELDEEQSEIIRQIKVHALRMK